MMTLEKKSRLRLRIEDAFRQGLSRVYDKLKVDPSHYLLRLQTAYGLPITGFADVYLLPLEQLDGIAAQTIRAGMKLAVVEGAGLGLAGMLTLVPDLSFLAVITMRTIQQLSLLYGFEYNTDEEIAELWLAAASAAGLDIARDMLEREAIRKLVPRAIQAIAVQGGKEMAEKWAGRVIPVLSSVLGAGLNYMFLRAWSNCALKHFREKHIAVRINMAAMDRLQLEPQAGQTGPPLTL